MAGRVQKQHIALPKIKRQVSEGGILVEYFLVFLGGLVLKRFASEQVYFFRKSI